MKFVDENGIEFVSEAAPMLPFSNETNADVINSLSKLLSTTIQLNSTPDDLPQSVKYGIEQAFLYKSIQVGNPLINFTIPKTVFVNSLFSLNDKLEGEFGATTKIKIGKDFSREFELIKKIPQKTKIRLDVNGAWDLGTAQKNLEILSAIKNIEYIEDPCRILEDNIKLGAEKLVKIAIDQECRSNDDIKKLEKIDEIDFLILKPALSGSLFELSEIIKNSPKKIIITSAFESYITRHSLILLASLLEHNYAHGLSTGTFLSNDTCKELYPLIDGEILLDSIIYPKDLSIEVK
ncbi:MAG: enolase C-terminal domain-like protein [Melioribacteraceae bacterium]